MTGHKIKNKNRGDAIARNAQRVGELRKEHTERLKAIEKSAGKAADRMTAFGERLDELEEFMVETKNILLLHHTLLRPWWVRLWDWVRRWCPDE